MILKMKPSKRSAATQRHGRRRSRRLLQVGLPIVIIAFVLGGGIAWLGLKASSIKSDLESAAALIPQLQQQVVASDANAAKITVNDLRNHTSAARQAAEDPAWTLAAGLPWVGPNLSAVAEVARSADDVAQLGLGPLVNVYESLDWDALLPTDSGSDLEPLRNAAPSITSAAYTVRASAERLENIDTAQLLPEVARPLQQTVEQLEKAVVALGSAADAASTAPAMLGGEGPRNYVLIIQNNAEARASGGIPGALAGLTLDNGKLSLNIQSSAGELGSMSPVLPVDTQQQQIYSTRLGKYMQDVNLTPDFPTAATTAKAMWEIKTGQEIDGVISLDPIALSYILEATGPVAVGTSQLPGTEAVSLPTELTADNVVPTLLSDVYAKIESPAMQDIYFAGVAKEVFAALSSRQRKAKGLIAAITRGAEERRVLAWSARPSEQSVLSKYHLSGAVSGPSVSPAQFGVYFNDGTGAKMDYYVKRSVQLVKKCPKDGYQETTVRITSTNTAPSDADQTLPAYVTGGGAYGVPPGSVQTNVVTYGPVQALVETAEINDERTGFASHMHSNRPVAVLAVRLAPGETKTVEITFTKIVQHAEPNLVVTPTVQAVKDVTLPTENASCI